MKIESFKQLKQEDVDAQYRNLIGKIGFSINTFCGQVLNALNNNLTIADNLNRELKSIVVTVDATFKPIATTEFKLVKLGNIKISGINVINVINQTNSISYPTSWPGIIFSQDSSTVTIKNVPGLVPNNKFNLTLEIIGS